MKTILTALREQGYSGTTIAKALGGTNIADAIGSSETYIVSFSANGGSGTVAPITCAAGATVTLPGGTGLTAPSNKEFSGWGTTSSATKTITTIAATANTTLYAVWVAA